MLNAKVRKYAVEIDGSIELDENLLDIFDTVDYTHLKGYSPSIELAQFDSVSKIFIDVETYSSNKLIFSAIIEKLQFNLILNEKDKIAINFALSQLNNEEVTDFFNNEYFINSIEINYIADFYHSTTTKKNPYVYTLIDFIEENIDEWDKLDEVVPKAALSADYCQIGLIGLINETGKYHIIDCEVLGEKVGLMILNEVLKIQSPLIIGQFNGFSFDLPVIIAKCRKYKIECPFQYTGYEVCFRAAQLFGKPQKYRKIIFTHKRETAVFDLFHHTLAWDFVARKLTAFSLKKAPIQLGLRKTERLELTYSQMKSEYASGDLSKLKEYLYYDLEDTLLMGNFLLPEVYYQKLILPDWHLQSIATGGAGSKWDSVLKNIYKINKKFTTSDVTNGLAPVSEEKKSIKGGLTGGKPGLYKHVAKWDFNSMYPHIMLLFGLNSIKDVENKQLEVLFYLLSWRLELKAKVSDESVPKEERKLAKQIQGALKILINSSYGSLATKGILFNDYTSAALVTAYGRALLKYGVFKCIEFGGTPISWDTDGLYYSAESPEKLREIYEKTQENLPKGFTINLEVENANAMYIPLAKNKKSKAKAKTQEQLDEQFENIFEFESCKAMKKSYIIVHNENKIFANGCFRKRDKSRLECEFIPNLVKEVSKGNNPEVYYKETLEKLRERIYPVKDLVYNTTIKANEKRKVELGLGKPGDSVSIYRGTPETVYGKRGLPLKNKNDVWTKNETEVDYEEYVKIVEAMYAEFTSTCQFRKPELSFITPDVMKTQFLSTSTLSMFTSSI